MNESVIRRGVAAWQENAENIERRASLQHGGGGGTFDGMEIIDAKIAAAEARTDTKFAELLGEMRMMNQRLDHVERTTSGIKSTVVVTGIASAISIIGIVVAVMAYGGQLFGIGMDAQQVSDRAAQSALQKSNDRIDGLDRKLDQLLQATKPRLPQ